MGYNHRSVQVQRPFTKACTPDDGFLFSTYRCYTGSKRRYLESRIRRNSRYLFVTVINLFVSDLSYLTFEVYVLLTVSELHRSLYYTVTLIVQGRQCHFSIFFQKSFPFPMSFIMTVILPIMSPVVLPKLYIFSCFYPFLTLTFYLFVRTF